MSLSTYHERKKEGLCPNCGGERLNPDFVLCHGCRGRVIASPNKPNTRIPFVEKRLFFRSPRVDDSAGEALHAGVSDMNGEYSDAKLNIATGCFMLMSLAFFQLDVTQLIPMLLFAALASLATWALTTCRKS